MFISTLSLSAFAGPLCLWESFADVFTRSDYVTNSMLRAVKDDFNPNVARLLNCGADPNARYDSDNTATHSAVRRGLNDVIHTLVTHSDNDLNLQNQNGNTVLHFAVYFKQDSAVDHILSNEAVDLNIVNDSGNTPLNLAIKTGNDSAAYKLLSAGADPNIRDQEDNSPLFLATYFQNEDVVAGLLDHGAELRVRNKSGWTAFEYAFYNKYTGITDQIRAYMPADSGW